MSPLPPLPAASSWRAWLGLALAGALIQAAAAAPPIEVAAHRITSALTEGVALSLRESPGDARGLVLIGTRLDDVAVRTIQDSPAASSDLVEAVAARCPISPGTRHYMTRALIGFSQICADYPPPRGGGQNPNVLKLILAFRRGVKAGTLAPPPAEP